MEFMVSRTSTWNEGKPCDEAYWKSFDRLDVRTLGSFEEFDNKFFQNFTDRGRDHTINERGFIQRSFDDEGWFVVIRDLEELIAFKDKYGDIIIGDSIWNKNITEIEIYDGYRE